MRGIPESLALLRPDDLFPVWCLVDSLEQAGEMAAGDAARWKHGVYALMMRWNLEPDEVLDGTVSGPPGGLLEGGDLFGVADGEGHASLPVEIALFGTYTWDANSIQGSFTVEAECPE